MKTRLYFLILFFGFSMYAISQMRVENGQVMIGAYNPDAPPPADLSLYSHALSGATRLSFNTYSLNGLNVFVGRYPCKTSPMLSQLHLHGADGFYLTSDGSPIMYYPASCSEVYFNPDVIGHFFTPSDGRFKENIQPLLNALSGLKELSGISYRLKNTQTSELATLNNEVTTDANDFVIPHSAQDTRTHFGFLAQEVKEVYPELVRTDSAGYMYIDYIGMIPLIVNALNEIQAKVDSQETVIAELQKELAALRDGTPIGGALRKSERRNTAVESESAIVPALYQNNPNPFSATTVIRFALPYETQQADLYIYNLQGEQIRRMEIADRGEGKVTLQGSELSAGMYIYSLVADGKEIDSKRMILTK